MGAGNGGMMRDLEQSDQHATNGGVEIDTVQLGDIKVKRSVYPIGWRFSKDMGADRCLDTHVGYVISGRMGVELDDGTRFEAGAGSVFLIPAGHDGWVIGDQPCVMVQFDEGESAARRFNAPSVAKAAA
jgi:ethanolamine utilization protein EutQ (cupin superfamily)